MTTENMNSEETKALIQEMIEGWKHAQTRLKAQISALESYFNHTVIDAYPYVITLKSNVPQAVKVYPDGCYNFAADGLDAYQVSRTTGEQWVDHIRLNDTVADRAQIVQLESKYDFFKRCLESHRKTLVDSADWIEKGEARLKELDA